MRGTMTKGGVNKRFTEFVAPFMFDGDPSPDEYAEVLYSRVSQPASALVQLLSGGLSHYGHRQVAALRGAGAARLWRPTHFVISVEALVQAFVTTVRGYEAAVRTRDDLQAKFTKMFPTYGSIGVVPFGDTSGRDRDGPSPRVAGASSGW